MWMVGLIGLEPMTLRLSSACSNQLSYRPKLVFNRSKCGFEIETKLWKIKSSGNGGRGIRTPDIQLAKLALYQLSYTPLKSETLSMADATDRAWLGPSGWQIRNVIQSSIAELCASHDFDHIGFRFWGFVQTGKCLNAQTYHANKP